ncbi:Panacea domain-containing protein [Flavobacterium eburneipallidum]|uniref:Panacea domain-containing protein n=1 Tax=Flavobacterium eburneipallidum TaxID=3003263 RepID=UPI0022ABFB2A|nr:type II toxin-antitoxin system antitoxin SocA domain-containing protein [Flavobacterium eburneipallidum]
MAQPALNIACYFVNRAFSEKVTMTNLKLQKMIYIANGIYIAKHKEPLIIERVEVWAYGPVIKPVYDCFKRFGADNINKKTVECDIIFTNYPNAKELEILEATWDLCKELNGIQLSNWTHRPESPWTISMNNKKSFIPDDLLGTYFDQFLKKN